MTADRRSSFPVDNGVEDINLSAASSRLVPFPAQQDKPVCLDRLELGLILNLYGRFVAAGEWRDYALTFGSREAEFAIFRRASEQPLYRVVKCPEQSRKQALYAVVAQGGLILRRGNDLAQVLRVLVKKPRLAEG